MKNGTTDLRPRRAPAIEPPAAFLPFAREEIEQTIPSRFERQARLYPDRLAVKTERHAWTYDALNRAANRVAHAILARDGKARTPVAILTGPGAPHVAALLGVLKAGKIVVPLDPSHPAARLAQFVDEARPTSIVTHADHRDLAARLAGVAMPVVAFDALAPGLSEANPGLAGAPDDPAMILYTSGSTGQPKGVLCDHRAWIHNARNYTNAFYVCREDRATLLAHCTAQAVKNLLMAILNGATVFPFDARRQGLVELAALMRREEITIAVMSASLFRSFVDLLGLAEEFPRLRLIRIESEPVLKSDVDLYKRHFSRRCLLVNGLASSETQTVSHFCIAHDTELPDGLVPVGYPAEDKTILLLDENGREVEPGKEGEIVLKSRYLALGYWRRPELTDAVFRSPPAMDGTRLYFTGDLGRMTPDGCLVCLGRKDARVKIRGHGVDPVEIEMALRKVAGVKDAAVQAHLNAGGYAYLVAYVVPLAFPGPTNMFLRAAVAATLPDTMVPTTFVVLGDLPRTSSGKIDRQALPAPGRPYRDPNRPAIMPRTPMEKSIAAIWSEITDRETIGVHDHFYDLGGESLQAMRIMARIRKTFNVDVDLQSLVDAPTVAEMAVVVTKGLMAGVEPNDRARLTATEKTAETDKGWTYLMQIQPGAGDRPVFFLPGGNGDGEASFLYNRLVHHVGPEYPFYSLKPRSAEGKVPAQESIEEMARDYIQEIRELQPEGPYTLIGGCGGGIVAYEIAQQLRAEGHQIAALILLDTRRPDLLRPFLKRLEKRLRNLLTPFRSRRKKARKAAAMLNEDRYRRMLKNKRSYARAGDRYLPRPYFGRMTLIVNEEWYRSNPDLGWKKMVRGGIDIFKAPGTHMTYTNKNGRVTAEIIKQCLEKGAA